MPVVSERERNLPVAEIAKLLEITVEHKDIISLGPGEPDFPAPRPLVAYTKKIAANLNHYSPVSGRHALKQAIVKKVRKENKIKADIENVSVTTGSMEGFLLACMCTSCSGERLVIPNPGYMGYVPCAELVDAVPVALKLREKNNFDPDPDDLKKCITSKTRAIVLNTPGNPTGNVIKKKILEEIADIAIDKGIYIVSDEAYEKITYDSAKHVSIASLNGMQDYAVSLFSFSKTYAMCGYRIGYCVGPEKLIAAISKAHTYTTLSAPTISQLLALKALSLPKKYTNNMVREYARRRKLIVSRLNDMGLITRMPEGAFYAFSNISNFSKNSLSFAHSLLKNAKVAVVPGSEFGCYGEGYIRCSFALNYDRIEQVMNRMEKFLKR